MQRTRVVRYPEGDEREIDHALAVNQLVDLNGFPVRLPLATAKTIVYRVWKVTHGGGAQDGAGHLPPRAGDPARAGSAHGKREEGMFVKKVLSRDESLLEVQGELSGETAAEFQQHLQDLVAAGHPRVTLNLAGVSTINSSSIGKILHFRKMLDEQGRTLQIRGCSEALFKTFQMINFDKLVTVERAPTA